MDAGSQINGEVITEVFLLTPEHYVSNGANIKEELISAEFNSHELQVTSNQSLETQIKLDVLDQKYHIESDTDVSIKQEMLHSELDIKPEILKDSKDQNPTGNERFSCSLCNYKSTRKYQMQTHMRIHTGESPFACTVCDRKFTAKGALKVHIRTHTGEKPFECNVCGRKFMRKSALTIHIRSHTGEMPFECNVCDRKFTQKSVLKVHMRIHTRATPFKCTVCERTFTVKSTLEIHMRMHIGETPLFMHSFSNVGGRQFKQTSTLNTREKPYKCNICNFKSSCTEGLLYHVTTHTPEETFQMHVAI